MFLLFLSMVCANEAGHPGNGDQRRSGVGIKQPPNSEGGTRIYTLMSNSLNIDKVLHL